MKKTTERLLTKFGILPGHLPNLIIPGVQKAATSSLHYYLTQHHSIVGGKVKEPSFFDLNQKFTKGKKWYKQQFPHARKYILDATPNYLYEKHTPIRIKKILGNNIRFIIVLRDPVSRCFSAWNMYRQLAKKPNRIARFAEIERAEPRYKLYSKYYQSGAFPDFAEAVDIELQTRTPGQEKFIEPGIVRRGFYVEHIKHWLSIFDREQILFLEQESLRGNALKASLQRIAEFLEIPPEWEQVSIKAKHVRSYEGKAIDAATELKLKRLYKFENQGLSELTGLDLSWPCLVRN